MFESISTPWDEKDYVRCLDHERHMFAWCLVTYGGVAEAAARTQAEEFYPFQSPADALRGMLFHDEAWGWAMLELFGAMYWMTRPELERASAEYESESARYERER